MRKTYKKYVLREGYSAKYFSQKEKDIMDVAIYIVEEKATLEQASNKFGVPKTTIHHRIHRMLPNLSGGLYKQTCKQLKTNINKYFRKGTEKDHE